jgi:L-amino acid N-acyltransferase YncA
MASPYFIRLACEDDINAVCEIWLEGASEAVDHELDPGRARFYRSCLARRLSDRSDVNITWIAQDSSGTVLGWQSLTPRANPINYPYIVESSTYVRRYTKVPGLAKALLETAIDHAVASSIQYIYGFATKKNRASKWLMRSFNFQYIGTVPTAAKHPIRDNLEFWVYVVPARR